MADESLARPYYTVLVLAFVCSALVAGAAVGLRPQQEANRAMDQKKHILYAAGLYDPAKTMEQMFAPIETRVVELATGEFVEDTIRPETYRQLKAALSEEQGRELTKDEDLAKVRRLEKYSLVYLVKYGEELRQIVLPVRGKGLWSTMFAFVALDGDLTTIRGVSFYEHGETPGLGGEVENSRWQEDWRGKKLYDEQGEFRLKFAKGEAARTEPARSFEIDGLSGATLTTKGVENLMEFWFGDHGFKPFLARMHNRAAKG